MSTRRMSRSGELVHGHAAETHSASATDPVERHGAADTSRAEAWPGRARVAKGGDDAGRCPVQSAGGRHRRHDRSGKRNRCRWARCCEVAAGGERYARARRCSARTPASGLSAVVGRMRMGRSEMSQAASGGLATKHEPPSAKRTARISRQPACASAAESHPPRNLPRAARSDRRSGS